MTSLTIQYFASLREQAGVSSEPLETAARTPAELYAELRERHGFSLPPDHVRFADDTAYIPADSPLRDGMRLTLIPPVAGG
ncbi:MAG: MoaD/ThiS family protein [Verrucomicrobia bacterium]|nr:MoaD/ThiS family protein [Verrucomicrobiota bacterium]MCH8514367.1 MoaD/ThiS family protein [Kiritimatiellia bacterium]